LKNIKKNITIEDLAIYIGCSNNHLIRVFKKDFATTPHAFIINQKIIVAKNIIEKSNNVKLAHVAKEVGFYDQSHFSRNFKKTFGITPNEYHKTIKGI